MTSHSPALVNLTEMSEELAKHVTSRVVEVMLDRDLHVAVVHGVVPDVGIVTCGVGWENCQVDGLLLLSDIEVTELVANTGHEELNDPLVFRRDDGREVYGYRFPFVREVL